jgi:hypothetical protein
MVNENERITVDYGLQVEDIAQLVYYKIVVEL